MTSSPALLPPDVHRFVSRDHPGPDATLYGVFGRSLVRPLTVCLLPVMIGALVAVLQAFPALAFLTVGFPLSVVVAAGWTLYQLQTTVAEIHVQPGSAALWTVWNGLRRQAGTGWMPIFELRRGRTTMTLALGDSVYELSGAAWPDADALLSALLEAREAGSLLAWRTPEP